MKIDKYRKNKKQKMKQERQGSKKGITYKDTDKEMRTENKDKTKKRPKLLYCTDGKQTSN